MKKLFCFMLALGLCLVVFSGCSQSVDESSLREEFCCVLSLQEDGIVVEIPDADLGYVYVRYCDKALEVAPLDTVVIQFSETDLKSAYGKFTDYFGETLSYSYIIDSPHSIRLADAAKGEPTFG